MKHYLIKLVDGGGWLAALLLGYATNWWQQAPDAVHNLLPTACGLVLADTLLRGLVAWLGNTYSSYRIKNAFVKIITYGVALYVAILIDSALGTAYAAAIIVLTLWAYREATSCLENISELGLPLPGIKKMVSKWGEEQEVDEDEDNG